MPPVITHSDEKFDAVFLATGSTFVGTPAFWLKEQGIIIYVKVRPGQGDREKITLLEICLALVAVLACILDHPPPITSFT